MTALNPLQDGIHRLTQVSLNTWARFRYADDIRSVERFCLFVGYPRSGHSIVGALFNAHRHAVIAHELNAAPLIIDGCARDELFTRILARAAWFDFRGNRGIYPYQVPNQWQGKFEKLKVIGDKRGGAVARCIAEHPGFLGRVRSLVGLPLRLIHVVRNPFDNISAISIRQSMPLEEAAAFYFRHCEVTSKLDRDLGPDEWITIHHEDMIAKPEFVLGRLCRFLGLELDAGYIEDCCGIVFPAPTNTRRKVSWPAPLRRDVECRIEGYSFLGHYTFE